MKYVILLFFLTGCIGSSSSDFESSLSALSTAPAVGSAFLMNGELLELNAVGVRKLGDPEPATTEDKFHLGSCTKAMTATLAAILIEEGVLTWTTKMNQIFTDMPMRSEYADMSFETLLVHRAGFPVNHSIFGQVQYLDPVLGRREIARTLLNSMPMNPIDSTYVYTNFSYIIAGHALEKLTGKSWEELMQEKIFSPLEMSSCGFGVTSSPNEIRPSEPWAHSGQMPNAVPLQRDNPRVLGPAGTVHCNLADWSKFLSAHLKGLHGEGNIVSSSTYKKLHSVHPKGDSDYTYGGWMLLSRSWANGPVLHHSGSNLLNFAVVWIAPNRNAILMGATNIGGDNGFGAADNAVGSFVKKYLSR